MKIKRKRDLTNRNKFHVWMCSTCAWSYSFDIDKCPRCEPDSTSGETSLWSKIKEKMFVGAIWGAVWSIVIGCLLILIFSVTYLISQLVGLFF